MLFMTRTRGVPDEVNSIQMKADWGREAHSDSARRRGKWRGPVHHGFDFVIERGKSGSAHELDGRDTAVGADIEADDSPTLLAPAARFRWKSFVACKSRGDEADIVGVAGHSTAADTVRSRRGCG